MDLEGIIGEGVKFTEEEIAELFNNPFARERTNFIAWAQERIPLIARVYDVPQEDIKKVILSHPRFAGLNHERVVNEATDVYGEENRDRVKKSILSFPPFAGYNHERVVNEVTDVYGEENRDRVKKSILSFPPFAGLNHERVVNEVTDVYGEENRDRVKKAILSHPPFANLNHERVVNEATDVYGEENRDRVKKSILSHPPFAGYNHERVVRQNSKLGKIIGLEKTEIIERILNNPVLSSYSVKRYIAGLDVCRVLQNEGFDKDKILYCYFGNISSSPYVPNHDRKRISQVENGEEPPLLIKMRKYLTKN